MTLHPDLLLRSSERHEQDVGVRLADGVDALLVGRRTDLEWRRGRHRRNHLQLGMVPHQDLPDLLCDAGTGSEESDAQALIGRHLSKCWKKQTTGHCPVQPACGKPRRVDQPHAVWHSQACVLDGSAELSVLPGPDYIVRIRGADISA